MLALISWPTGCSVLNHQISDQKMSRERSETLGLSKTMCKTRRYQMLLIFIIHRINHFSVAETQGYFWDICKRKCCTIQLSSCLYFSYASRFCRLHKKIWAYLETFRNLLIMSMVSVFASFQWQICPSIRLEFYFRYNSSSPWSKSLK